MGVFGARVVYWWKELAKQVNRSVWLQLSPWQPPLALSLLCAEKRLHQFPDITPSECSQFPPSFLVLHNSAIHFSPPTFHANQFTNSYKTICNLLPTIFIYSFSFCTSILSPFSKGNETKWLISNPYITFYNTVTTAVVIVSTNIEFQLVNVISYPYVTDLASRYHPNK